MFNHFYFLGGAAAVVSSAWAIAKLGLSYVQSSFFLKKKFVNQSFALRINLVVTTPLTENMPGPSATKPGDMWVLFDIFDYEDLMTIDSVYAMNGKSVEVDDTDAEGRLVLSGVFPFSDILWTSYWFIFADAIYYTATEYKPHTLIDVATLTS